MIAREWTHTPRLGNELIGGARPVNRLNRIQRRQRLGGLLNYYAVHDDA